MQLGTVIRGTSRNQDLIPTFLEELKERDEIVYNGFRADLPGKEILEDERHPWWDSEESMWVLHWLMDELSQCAPEGYYFGSHPGDGSDFGFWELEEEEYD